MKKDTKNTVHLIVGNELPQENVKSALLSDTTRSIELGDLVEGTVISIEGTHVYVDLKPYGTGIIYGREFMNARDMIRNMSVGDLVKGKVADKENKNGYIELSLKEARQALVWTEAEKAMKESQVLDLVIKEANKGGLIVEWQGILGFLPASQLKADNYPRVEDGDKDEILKELKKLVGQKMGLVILSVNPKEGKLIFSEKGQEKEEKKEKSTKYEIGDVLDCTVTGAVDFGIFLKIEDNLEGLVHISEIDWALVEDPKNLYKIGDKVQAQIIEIKDGKISLSIKRLKTNPWESVKSNYKKDDSVNGMVIKFNKYGALVSIQDGVAGLVHVSEFGDEKKMKAHLELGKVYPFKISLFDPKEHRMTLVFAGEKQAK